MNSNLKLLPAALLMAVLALAGCGGSSSDDEMPPPPPPPTPEEQCTADGGIYEDGECKSADDLREEGAKNAQDEADAAAAAKAAVALHNILGTDAGVPAVAVGDANPAGFTGASAANKSSQYFRLEGQRFSATTPTASDFSGTLNADLTGFYSIAAGSLGEVEAEEAGLFDGISQNTHDANATTGDLNNFVTAGTFMGVSGTLRCVGTCTSQGGSVTGGTWHFKPNNAMDRVKGAKIEWGWWLTRDADGDVTAVNRFRPNGPTGTLDASTGLGGLGEGTASYEGDATGQYAVVGDSGAFEAKASLTATFGAAEIPLSGSIHTFTGADGESRDWMVELKEIDDSGTPGDGAYTGGTTVWAGNEMASAWNANMFNGTGTAAPDVILGDFRAEIQGGRMAGVFGTEMQE